MLCWAWRLNFSGRLLSTVKNQNIEILFQNLFVSSFHLIIMHTFQLVFKPVSFKMRCWISSFWFFVSFLNRFKLSSKINWNKSYLISFRWSVSPKILFREDKKFGTSTWILDILNLDVNQQFLDINICWKKKISFVFFF